jgi:hypothetical protein
MQMHKIPSPDDNLLQRPFRTERRREKTIPRDVIIAVW